MSASGLGSAMVALANAYIVFDRSRSVAVTALIAVCWSLPPLVLPGVATSLVNRFGAPRTFIARYLASAVLSVIPAVLVVTGHLGTVPLLVWCLLMSTSAGLFSPSAMIVKRMLAPRVMLPEFNAAVARNMALTAIVGIGGGGVVFATIGPLWIYVFNAVSFVLPALAVIPLLRNELFADVPRQRFRSVFGLLFGSRRRRDLYAACAFTGLGIFIGGYTVTLPAIARSIGTSPVVLAVLQVAAVIGGLLTGSALRYLRGRIGWGPIQRASFAVMGLGVLALAWAGQLGAGPAVTLVLCVVAIAPIGFALSLDTAILNAAVHLWTPEESQAVFFTYFALIPLIAGPVGQGVVGVIADRASVSVALAALGVFTLVLVALAPYLRLRAEFDEMSRAEETP
jgi:MFS family permease